MKKLIYTSLFLLIFGSTWAQGSLSKGLVAYYPFNGNATDASGNNLNGTINGATLTTGYDGTANSAYSFNGSSNNISFSAVPTNNVNNWTLAAWVLPSNLNQLGIVLSNGADDATSVGNGYGFGIGKYNGPTSVSSGNSLLGIYSGVSLNQVSFTFSNTTSWKHIVMSCDVSGTVKFYVDGVLYASTYSSGQVPKTPKRFSIGAQSFPDGSNYVRYFSGSIDEVRVYNRALTECEIIQLSETDFKLATPTFKAPLVPKAICAGTASVFSINNVDGATSYEWSVNGVIDPSSVTTTLNKTLASSSNPYIISVRAIKGCKPSLSSSAAITSLNVLATPAAPSTISAKNGAIYACKDATKIYRISAISAGTFCEWNFNGTVLNGQNGNEGAITLSAIGGTYPLTVKTYTTDISTNTKCYNATSSSLQVAVNEGPKIPTIVGNAISCQYSNSNYSITPVDPTAIYGWATDNGIRVGITAGSKGVNASAAFPDIYTGNQLLYSMSVTAVNLCGSSTVQVPNAKVMNNFPIKPTIQCSGGAGCPTIQLATPASGAYTGIVWTIYNPTGITTISNQTSITRPKDVQIKVTLTNGVSSDNVGCKYSAWFRPCDETTGPNAARMEAEEINLPVESNFLIYPNPSTGTVTIETKGQVGKAYVFNTFGQVVAEVDLRDNEFIYSVQLESKGLYTFKIKSAGETSGYKVVVQ